jgi:hypothetical protein
MREALPIVLGLHVSEKHQNLLPWLYIALNLLLI